jgi:hypothetical protein
MRLAYRLGCCRFHLTYWFGWGMQLAYRLGCCRSHLTYWFGWSRQLAYRLGCCLHLAYRLGCPKGGEHTHQIRLCVCCELPFARAAVFVQELIVGVRVAIGRIGSHLTAELLLAELTRTRL